MNLNPSEIRTLVRVVTKRTGFPIHDEDLEQEAALNAVEAFRRLGPVKHPRALLMKIVRDTVHDHWRRRRPSSENVASIDERFLSHFPSFESDLDSYRQIQLLRRALDQLPSSRRSLLDLFYTQGYSISEIARLHNRTVSAVKMDLLRTRQALAQIIRSLSTKKSR